MSTEERVRHVSKTIVIVMILKAIQRLKQRDYTPVLLIITAKALMTRIIIVSIRHLIDMQYQVTVGTLY